MIQHFITNSSWFKVLKWKCYQFCLCIGLYQNAFLALKGAKFKKGWHCQLSQVKCCNSHSESLFWRSVVPSLLAATTKIEFCKSVFVKKLFSFSLSNPHPSSKKMSVSQNTQSKKKKKKRKRIVTFSDAVGISGCGSGYGRSVVRSCTGGLGQNIQFI